MTPSRQGKRYALTAAWHVIDTQAPDGGREMAAAVSSFDGDRIVAALNDNETLRAGLERCAVETDYCYACDNHPSHGHARNCPLRKASDAL